MVTDIGGLNDRGFNALAYKGLKQAKSELGADIRVADVEVQRRLRAEPLVAGAPEVRPRGRRRLPDGRRHRQGREVVPDHELRDRRLPLGRAQGQAQERPRAAVQGERGAATSRATWRGSTSRRRAATRSSRPSAGRTCPRSTPTSRATRPARRRPTRGSRRSPPTRRTSSIRRSARRSRSTRSARARRSSSRSRASAGSARSTPPRRRTSRASASTPTRATSTPT